MYVTSDEPGFRLPYDEPWSPEVPVMPGGDPYSPDPYFPDPYA